MKIWRIIFWILIAAVIILTIILIAMSREAKADENPETNISYGNYDYFSWNNVFGWADFHRTHSIFVNGQKLTGYASSSIGDVSLDCATTRNGNVCGQSNYGVKNDGSGYLNGYGWNQTIGWISFYCDQTAYGGPNVCSQAGNYRVTINTATGDFNGYGWNPIAGWISFNCADPSVCGNSNYKVNTRWRTQAASGFLESSIFDTQAQGGAILNSIAWQGSQPCNEIGGCTCVKFRIAVSNNENGPWDYKGSGENISQYFGGSCPGPNEIIEITGNDRMWVNNQRYLRYKIFLESNTNQSLSPFIEDVILNWSK